MSIQSCNPATGAVEKTFEVWKQAYLLQTLDEVAAAWKRWKMTGINERVRLLRAMAEQIRSRRGEAATIIAREMGKPVTQGRFEVDRCAGLCEFYADNGAEMLASKPVQGACAEARVHFQPLGTLFAVMPWNFPFWQAFRCAVPALLAGNTMVLKHASNVPQSALMIEEIVKNAGVPRNVFRTLLISVEQVESVLAHPSVCALSLTGSQEAGRSAASLAARYGKKSVLELGGSDPFVVLDDADIEEAAQAGVRSRCANSGQVCIAAKRFIVMESVFDDFVHHLKQGMADLTIGDPLNSETDMGPLSSLGLRARLQGQVDACLEAGGKVVCGCRIPEGDGAFYPPSIITHVPSDTPVCREEMFGPVALVFSVRDEEEAIALANDTPFGLAASVWTGNRQKGQQLAESIEAGVVYVNGMVRSEPNLPFGGVKNSGYGRELAAWGPREFTNVKSICLE